MMSNEFYTDYLSRARSSSEPVAKRQSKQASQEIRRRHIYFVSYSHEDMSAADHVELLLRRSGRDVWRDETETTASEPIADNIKRGIENADTFVALWSESYEAGERYCMPELDRALEIRGQRKRSASASSQMARLRVVLLLLDDTEPDWKCSRWKHLDGKTRADRHASVLELMKTEDRRSPGVKPTE